jgi:enoyl-[acyl-carrier protein] reductase/trans-2-enoyl-CoA reductase (NAD+)
MELGRDSMVIFRPGYAGEEVRLDDAYQATMPEFHLRKAALGPKDLPDAFRLLYEDRG